jgi:putative Holliday junction resolvase
MITRITSQSVLVLTAIITFYLGRLVTSSFSLTFFVTNGKISRVSHFPSIHLNNYGTRNMPWSSATFKSGLKSTSSPSSNIDYEVNDNDSKAIRNENVKNKIINAAAQLTTSTSSLLNIKSVGVDYGLVRTGIAVSNGGYNPEPLSIISHLNNTQLCNRIVNIVQNEKAHQIVLGLPFHKNGTEAEQTTITRNFASMLNCAVCAHFGIDKVPIYLWDERYTSQEAESRIRAANPRAGLLYKELDADAASIILECYYSENGKGAEKVELPDDEDIRKVVERAWLKRKEEKQKEIDDLRQQRMNAGNRKQELMEKAKLLDAKLAEQYGSSDGVNGKKGTKKKKKKRQWIDVSKNI